MQTGELMSYIVRWFFQNMSWSNRTLRTFGIIYNLLIPFVLIIVKIVIIVCIIGVEIFSCSSLERLKMVVWHLKTNESFLDCEFIVYLDCTALWHIFLNGYLLNVPPHLFSENGCTNESSLIDFLRKIWLAVNYCNTNLHNDILF